jgi:CRP-like cAMP-binding protein
MPSLHEKLAPIARAVSFREGERLVRQGEASRGAFVIRNGAVEAQVALPGGGVLAVAELGEGDMFGEMALVERGVCTASVVAKSALEAWFVGRDDFRAMVACRDPGALEVQREITRVLAAKLRALNAKVRGHAAAEQSAVKKQGQGKREQNPPSFDWRAFVPLLSFFEGFDAEETEELLSACRAFELPRDAPLFEPGAPADACFIVVRGALEIFAGERRVAIAGPGELVGYLAILEGGRHAAGARVREAACLLEMKAERFLALYNGGSGTAVSLQHAIHLGMLRALGRTNTQLTRLIAHARLREASREVLELEKVLHAQI